MKISLQECNQVPFSDLLQKADDYNAMFHLESILYYAVHWEIQTILTRCLSFSSGAGWTEYLMTAENDTSRGLHRALSVQVPMVLHTHFYTLP